MQRILHVLGIRWWSAIAAYAVDVASAQHRAGREVHVAVLADSPAHDELVRRGLSPAVRFGARPWHQPGLARALRRLIEAAGIDVLHVHTGLGHAAADVARARLAAPPPLVRTRADIRAPRATPGNRFLYARTDAVVVTGGFQRAGLLRLGVPEDRTAVVLGPVDTEHFAPDRLPPSGEARGSLELPAEGVLVGHIARLSPVKGHAVSIRALAELRSKTGRDVHLVISGEEFQTKRAALRTLAEREGVGACVHLRDRCADVRDLLAAIDVGVVASTGSEAVCRIAAELMASGRPLVASRVGVLPEMVTDGETGETYPAGDAAALAACLSRVTGDAERTRAMVARARRKSEAWSFPAAVSAYDTIYAEAAARRVGVPS